MKTKIMMLFACLIATVMITSCSGGDPKESKEYKDLKAELDGIKAQDSLEAANIELYKKMSQINDTTEIPQLDQFMATDLKFYDMPEGMPNGLEGYKALMKEYFVSIPNAKIEIKHILAEGDMVMAHVNMQGVNTGASMGMPATNKSVNVDAFDRIRVKDGKIVEYWSVADMLKMMTQLGMMPEMGAEEKKGS